MANIPPVPIQKDAIFTRFLEAVRNTIQGKIELAEYTTLQRDNVTSWKRGQMIYNITVDKAQCFDGTNNWRDLW